MLFQAKATLDTLVQILIPVCGDLKGVGTFGNAGKDVSNVLRNNTKQQYRRRAEELAEWIDDHHAWLEHWIDGMRDVVAHEKPLPSSGFVRKKVTDGVVYVDEPRDPEGTPYRVLMGALIAGLTEFCEEFWRRAVEIGLPAAVRFVPNPRFEGDDQEPRYVLGA